MSLQAWRCRAALSLALLFGGVVFAAAEQRAPSGRAVMAWHVTIAPAWFDPSSAPPQITPFGMLYAIHDALVRPYPGQKMGPSLAESWTESEDGLIYEFKLRPNLKFHNGDPLTTEDVEVQLRALQGRRREDPARARHAGRDRRSARRALSPERAVARFHDVLRHDGQRRRPRRAEEVPRPRSATTASRSTRSAPAPTNSSAPSRASRSCSKRFPTTGGACRT